MKHVNKRILIGTALAGALMCSGYEVNAAVETKIYPITNKMVDAVKNAPTAEAALDALCKQGGIVRGSGFTAGDMCGKFQDFARLALAACSGYVSGKDTFAGSNCEKKAAKLSVTDPERAADGVRAAVEVKVDYLTNSRLLVCGPEALGVGLAAYRAKLPARLKAIADTSCPSPARPTTAAPSVCPRANASQLKSIASARGLEAPVEFTAAMKKTLDDNEVRDVIDEVTKLLNHHTAAVCVLDGLKAEGEKAKGAGNSAQAEKIQAQEQSLAAAYTQAQEMLSGIKADLARNRPLERATLPNVIKQRQTIETQINNSKKMCCSTGLWTMK